MGIGSMIFKGLAVVSLLVKALYDVSMIGKPRQPLETKDGMAQILVSTAWIAAILVFWGT